MYFIDLRSPLIYLHRPKKPGDELKKWRYVHALGEKEETRCMLEIKHSIKEIVYYVHNKAEDSVLCTH